MTHFCIFQLFLTCHTALLKQSYITVLVDALKVFLEDFKDYENEKGICCSVAFRATLNYINRELKENTNRYR